MQIDDQIQQRKKREERMAYVRTFRTCRDLAAWEASVQEQDDSDNDELDSMEKQDDFEWRPVSQAFIDDIHSNTDVSPKLRSQ